MTAPSPDEVALGAVEGVKENAGNLNLQWNLRPATVISQANGDVYQCMYDGDSVATLMISMVGRLAAEARVMVMVVPPSGNYIIALAGGSYPKLIARGERTTQSTASAAAQGVLRLDDIPIKAGHFVTVHTSSLVLFSTVAGDNPSARLSYVFGVNDAATTSDTLMALWNSPDIASVGDGAGGILNGRLPVQTSDGVVSILLYTIRIVGTGNVSIFASANFPAELRVIDWGPDPLNTGVLV